MLRSLVKSGKKRQGVCAATGQDAAMPKSDDILFDVPDIQDMTGPYHRCGRGPSHVSEYTTHDGMEKTDRGRRLPHNMEEAGDVEAASLCA